jgi:hypothetical protein
MGQSPGEISLSLRQNAGSILVLRCERARLRRLAPKTSTAPEFDGARWRRQTSRREITNEALTLPLTETPGNPS